MAESTWDLPRLGTATWVTSSSTEAYNDTGALGSMLGVFDFSQIELGATVKVTLSGVGYGPYGPNEMKVRACDVSDWGNADPATGDELLSGDVNSGGGAFEGFVLSATFTNIYSTVKELKLTGRKTSGTAVNLRGVSLFLEV